MKLIFIIFLVFLASCSNNTENEKEIKQAYIERIAVKSIDTKTKVNWVGDTSIITYFEDKNNNRYVCEYSYGEYFCFGKGDTYFKYDGQNLFREVPIR